MNRKCNIVKDLIPLYAEDMVSKDTKSFVEDHLKHCEQCRCELAHTRRPAGFVPDTGAAPLSRLKKKLLAQRLQAVFFTAALVSAIAVSVFAVLTSPQFFPYSQGLVQVTAGQPGTLTIAFDSRVTGYSYTVERDNETGTEIYCISAWHTVWDQYFTNRSEQNMVITPASHADTAVYYEQNNGSGNVLLYGQNASDSAGSAALPRLILTQYFLTAVLALILLIMARFLFRRLDKAKVWLNRMMPLPAAYILAHICTKGFSFKSYSAQRDFSIIILAAILLYGVMLSGSVLYKARKKQKAE